MIDNILLILLLVLLSAKLVGSFFDRIGLDSTLGELLTGIVFGRSLLNIIPSESIEPFAIIGSVLILFVAGMKQEKIEEIYKDKPALKLGVLLFFLTTVIMSIFLYFIAPLFGVVLSLIQSIIIGVSFAIVDIGVPAKVLISKGLIRTPFGRITIRSAIINILLGLLVFTILTVFVGSVSNILYQIIGIVVFFLVTLGLIFFLSKITKFVMRLHVEEAEFSLAIVLVLALAYFTEILGFSNILGAFIAGVMISRLPFSETRSFSDKIKSISFGLFVPLFFVWFGLEINIAEILKNLLLSLVIFLAYVLIRFTITYVFAIKHKMRNPPLISSLMLSVDVESLVVLIIAIRLGLLVQDTSISLFAPSVVLSTVLVVVLVSVFSKKINSKKTQKA